MNRTRERDAENVRVVVRCRKRNDREIASNSKVIVNATSDTQICIAPRIGAPAKIYAVDKVFDAETDQRTLYAESIRPMVDDFLSGINCTVFAYGQTGTGKTYTISGDCTNTQGPHAGVIPRVFDHIFEYLQTEGTDFSLSCQYLEVYNEQLGDLLVETKAAKPLRLLDDPARKTVKVRGLQECYINSAASALELIASANAKRKAAATSLNSSSSRSHAIFTLKLAVGHKGLDARYSKLHLVDLAGSESIARSGAEKDRAREAGSINQSLLVLGRVISGLVDGTARVPYRDSKLTRILQDSLGGSTRTCLIATLSPVLEDAEESLSTLEYASRAKNIKNHPQIAPGVSKPVLLRELARENEALRSELKAQRDSDNGVFMPATKYQGLLDEQESKEQELLRRARRINLQEDALAHLESALKETTARKCAAESALEKSNLQLAASVRQISELASESTSLKAQNADLALKVGSLAEQLSDRDQYAASQREELCAFQGRLESALGDLEGSISELESSAESRRSLLKRELAEVLGFCRRGYETVASSAPLANLPFSSGSEQKHKYRVELARGVESIEHAVQFAVESAQSNTARLFQAARDQLKLVAGYTQELKRTLEHNAIAVRAVSQLAHESKAFFGQYTQQARAVQELENRRQQQLGEAEEKLLTYVRAVFADQRKPNEEVNALPDASSLMRQIEATTETINATSTVTETLQTLDRALGESRACLQVPKSHTVDMPEVSRFIKCISTSIDDAIVGVENEANDAIASVRGKFAQQLNDAQIQLSSAQERLTLLAAEPDVLPESCAALHRLLSHVRPAEDLNELHNPRGATGEIGRGVTVRLRDAGQPAAALQEIVNDGSGLSRKRKPVNDQTRDSRKKGSRNIY